MSSSSFPQITPIDPPEIEDGPIATCAECGADWQREACEPGCSNDLDTSWKEKTG